uniref:Uncharacterized protein n=1 Tax=Coccolithus braarudii TaxID=221442 RepID=A0A6T7CXN5_9EUKA
MRSRRDVPCMLAALLALLCELGSGAAVLEIKQAYDVGAKVAGTLREASKAPREAFHSKMARLLSFKAAPMMAEKPLPREEGQPPEDPSGAAHRSGYRPVQVLMQLAAVLCLAGSLSLGAYVLGYGQPKGSHASLAIDEAPGESLLLEAHLEYPVGKVTTLEVDLKSVETLEALRHALFSAASRAKARQRPSLAELEAMHVQAVDDKGGVEDVDASFDFQALRGREGSTFLVGLKQVATPCQCANSMVLDDESTEL